jgi:uncharacterized tellurite resistance protein B-like protein
VDEILGTHKVGGALERDEPVTAPAVLIRRAQQADGRADVVEREREEQLLRIAFPARDQRAQLAVVAVRIGDRLGERWWDWTSRR